MGRRHLSAAEPDLIRRSCRLFYIPPVSNFDPLWTSPSLSRNVMTFNSFFFPQRCTFILSRKRLSGEFENTKFLSCSAGHVTIPGPLWEGRLFFLFPPKKRRIKSLDFRWMEWEIAAESLLHLKGGRKRGDLVWIFLLSLSRCGIQQRYLFPPPP